jgi:predicted Zn-dependent protease
MQEAKYTEAAAALVRCLEIDPGHGECRRLYANVLMHLGQPERAEEQIRQFLHNPPTERPPDLPSKPLPSFGGNGNSP